MFAVLDNRKETGSVRQKFLESLIGECQQSNHPLLNELLQYYFQTESPNALQLIKQFNETGKEQSKILIEHLNNQGLKSNNRHSMNLSNADAHHIDEQEKIAHTMKVFRILCLIIHKPVAGFGALIKDSLLLNNCIQAVTRYKEDPNILAQACYFFAALTATLPGEIIQQTEPILNIYKGTCKYLFKNQSSLEQLSIQTNSHSLENVQLWIVNQSAHALFYTLYTTYPCNFLFHINREFQRNENIDVFEKIFFPMFQRVRFNPRLIDSDRKRETDKEKRSRHDSYYTIYEARKLSLDPLYGREPPAQRNWMHQEMKKILPFHQFKRQTPTNSANQLYDGRRSMTDLTTPVETSAKRSGSSPFQKLKEKIKSFVRPSSTSSPATTISTPDPTATASASSVNSTNTNNMISNVSSSMLITPSLSLGPDIRAVKTMPELQTNNETSNSSSTSNVRRSDQEHQQYVRSVINKISSIYDQNLPSHWLKILGRYDPTLLTVQTPHRQAIFYVSPSEHSLDNQQHQQQRLQFDDGSPTSLNEKRQRCASASCASSHHVHSPVLAAPTTSTDDILSRTQSLSTKQRTRHSTTITNISASFFSRQYIEHPSEYDDDDTVLIGGKDLMESCSIQIPTELYCTYDMKTSIIDELAWNDHDFISIPHFDFNDIVTEVCSPVELKRFDRLYQCHSSYEIFLTKQYKKIWEHLWAKQKNSQKHFNDLQTTRGFMGVLNSEIHRHLSEELALYENQSKCISDENTLLGDKVVELSKITTRRKQNSSTDENNKSLQDIENNCLQLRKLVNNETLKLNHCRFELENNEKESKHLGKRLEQLKHITKNIGHLNELNQQTEYQYLRLSDEMPVMMKDLPLSSYMLLDEDELHHGKSTPSTTTNGLDENSEIDSVSFNDEHRDEIDDYQQQEDSRIENYDQLVNEVMEILANQNSEQNTNDIEEQAYTLILEYMQSKTDMQNYLLKHNTHYIDLYLKAQQDYIEQMEIELSSAQSMMHQMPHVAI